MKKNVLLIMWLALAALLTVSTMSACSDDDNNENGNVGGVTIDGVDQVEYFRLNLGVFSSNDSIVCPLMMTAADELTPTVFSYYVDDEDNAEDIFLSWIPDQARGAVVRDGSTIFYTPRDAQGAPQGTITFHTALPTETATLAVVEFKGVSKMLGVDKIKFQPESAKPDNGNMTLPEPIYGSTASTGRYWFWDDNKKAFSYTINALKYIYSYPKLIEGKEFRSKVPYDYSYNYYGCGACIVGAKVDADFSKKLKELGFDKHDIIVSSEPGGYVKVVRANFNNGWYISPTNVINTVNEEDTTKYWVCQGYYWDYKKKTYTY